jgi:Outer membrane protein beta-barrel domain
MHQPLPGQCNINNNREFMKTIALIFIVFLSFMNIQAQDQIKKGVYTLSGGLSYSSTSYKFDGFGYDESNVTLAPAGSYFIVDQFELSFGVEYDRTTMTPSGSIASKFTSSGLELGARFYFPCEKVAPFIGANGQVSWNSMNGEIYSTPSTSLGFTGGLEVFISGAAAIEPFIDYNIYHSSDFTSQNQFRFGIAVKYFIF